MDDDTVTEEIEALDATDLVELFEDPPAAANLEPIAMLVAPHEAPDVDSMAVGVAVPDTRLRELVVNCREAADPAEYMLRALRQREALLAENCLEQHPGPCLKASPETTLHSSLTVRQVMGKSQLNSNHAPGSDLLK